MHHFNRPNISNNSLIRDQKSNKHIANGCKKLVHTFKREAAQFLVAKNLALNHLPLEALPAVQTWTANCKRHRKAVTFCGLRLAVSHEKPDPKGLYYLHFNSNFKIYFGLIQERSKLWNFLHMPTRDNDQCE